jgi:hypothetical protein
MVEGAGFSRFGSAAAAKMVEGAGSSTFAVEQAARRHRRTAYNI